MKKSKVYCGLTAVLCVLTFSGCKSELPLNQRMIVQNAGVDIEKEQVTLSLNAYLADRTAAGEKENASEVFFSQSGYSVSHASEQIGTISGRSPFFPHNQAVVIGRKTAENGIGRALSFFAEYHECRGAIPLLIAQESAEELLKNVGEKGSIPARELASLSEFGFQSGNAVNTEVFEAMQCLYDATRDFCAPILRLEKTKEEEPQVKIGATALFSGDRLVAELNSEQTKGLLLASGKANLISFDLSVPNRSGEYVAVRVTAQGIQTKITCKAQGEQASVQIEITCNMVPTEWDFSLQPMLDDLFADEILRLCKQELLRVTQSAIAICAQQYGADPFGFGRHLAQQQPQWWQQYGSQWKTLLKNCDYAVLVHCTLKKENK